MISRFIGDVLLGMEESWGVSCEAAHDEFG